MKLWTGFLDYLTGMSYGSSGDLYQYTTDGRYGRYYFSYDYNLVQFMQYCVNLTQYYEDFQPYINMGSGSRSLIENAGLISAFQKFATEQPTHFGWCQDTFFYNTVVTYAMNDASSRGLSFTDIGNEGNVVGTIVSFYYEHYQTGISFTIYDNAVDEMVLYITDPMTSLDIADMLNAGYDVFINCVSFYPWFQQRSSAINADPNDYLDLPETEPTRPSQPTPPIPPTPPISRGSSSFWRLWFNLGIWKG